VSAWLGGFLFVVAILLVVVIHEAGHFTVAKAFGIKVEEFFVGFGPRLWSFRRGETEYGVKALPFGGYVRIAGMNPYEEPAETDLPRTFGAKPVWQRALVIFAGPCTHFVLAFLILIVYFGALGAPTDRIAVVATVAPTLNGTVSPAQQAGFRVGDRIVAIDGRPVRGIDQVISIVRSSVGHELAVEVSRDGRSLTLRGTPVLSQLPGETTKVGRLGFALDEGRERVGPVTAVRQAGVGTWDQSKLVVLQLRHVFGPAALKRIGQELFGNAPRQATDPTSIVGVTRIAGQAAATHAWDVLIQLLVLFNVFIGIINLVPLPPLDGGHLAVLAYEKIRRRKPDLRKLVPVSATVAAFIVAFALAVAYLDIVKPLPLPGR
jgi:membrane-associated protease RseP (regulator of RpoE activity)